jgi:hypothetical protein
VLPILARYPVYPGMLNLVYAYADQSPVLFGDPTGGGILNSIKCFIAAALCLPESADCRDAWQRKFQELYRHEDYEQLQELLDEKGVTRCEDFIVKVCFRNRPRCREALKECPQVTFPGGVPGVRPTL